jgi:hypothetical protein
LLQHVRDENSVLEGRLGVWVNVDGSGSLVSFIFIFLFLRCSLVVCFLLRFSLYWRTQS